MHLLGFTSDISDVNDISSGQDNDIDVSMMCCLLQFIGKVNRPTMFFYLAVATSTAKISLGPKRKFFL